MEPIFAAVLGPVANLETMLRADAILVHQRANEDELVTAARHYLYVGDTPLHLAAGATKPLAVKTLIAAGVDPRAVNRRKATALHYACDPRPHNDGWDPADQAAVIAALVAAGADPNAADMDGVRPLHRAVRARSPAAVAALLKAGAQICVVSKRGSTPMDLTKNSTGAGNTGGSQAACEEIVALLRGAGA